MYFFISIQPLYQSIWAPGPSVGYAPQAQEYAPQHEVYGPQVGYAPPTQQYAPPPQDISSQAYAPQDSLDDSELGFFPKKLFKFGLKKPQKYYNTVNYYYPAQAPSYGTYGNSYGSSGYGGYGSSGYGNSGYGSGGCYGGCGGYAHSYGPKKEYFGGSYGGHGGYRSAGLGSPNPMADEDPMQQQSNLFPMVNTNKLYNFFNSHPYNHTKNLITHTWFTITNLTN